MNSVLVNYYIKLLKAALNNENAQRIPDSVDLKELVSLASAQAVDAMICTKLAEILPEDNDEGKNINERVLRHQYISEMRTAEYELLCKELIENKVRFMPVKGILFQDVYPQPYYRQMGDIDMLVEPDDFDNAEKVAKSLGYNIKNTSTHHDEWRKGNFLFYEIHRHLVGYSIPEFRKYYEDGWKFAHGYNGTMYKMSDEDLYIYNMVHMTKHFKNGGIGIKAVTDIYMFLKAHGDSLDWEYIHGEWEKLGIRSFCENCERLARAWFGNGEITPMLSELGMYFITSGSFGTQYNMEMYRMSVQSRKANGKDVRLAALCRSLFPSYGIMTQSYDRLKKRPFLLPVYWLIRIFTAAKNKKLGQRINQMKQIETNELKNINEFYNEIGL